MLWLRSYKLQNDFSGIKYCVRSCENECMYSQQVKFNNEIIYYNYILLTQLSIKWLFFCLGIPQKFQEHDILTFQFVTCKQSGPYTYSWFNKGCFGYWKLSNSTCKLLFGGHSGKSLNSYDTQIYIFSNYYNLQSVHFEFHCLVCPNAQQATFIESAIHCSFWRSDNHKL